MVRLPVARSEPPPPLPSLEDTKPALRPSFDAEDLDSLAFEPPAPTPGGAGATAESVRESMASRPPRARNWGLKVGGLIAAAAVMAGAVVVFKVGGRTHSGTPPLILASTTPTRVAPPSEATIRTANETGALLTRDTAQPTPTPPKLVNPPEAPVDLAARPAPAAASSAAASPAASTSPAASAAPAPGVSAEGDASPVAPSSDTPIVATKSAAALPLSPVGADPNRVKTISVRPDGTLISSGYESATAQKPAPSPTPTSLKATTVADAESEAATPAVALPTKLSPPKAAARVVARTPTTAPADDGAGPAPVAPKPRKPAPVAEAAPTTDDANAAPEAASGGYAVQLAAPRSESEAKALIRRLQSRYSDALGGTALGVRKAQRDGEPIYRVRAGGLSRAAASAMCAKVKSAGGDCYVAKN